MKPHLLQILLTGFLVIGGCSLSSNGYLDKGPTLQTKEEVQGERETPLEMMERQSLLIIKLKQENKELQDQIAIANADKKLMSENMKKIELQNEKLSNQMAIYKEEIEKTQKDMGALKNEILTLKILKARLEQRLLSYFIKNLKQPGTEELKQEDELENLKDR